MSLDRFERGIELLFDAGYLGGYLEAMRHISAFLADERKRALIPLGYLRYLDSLVDAWGVCNAAWAQEFSEYEALRARARSAAGDV